MLTKDAITTKYANGQTEWNIPIEWHAVGVYRRHGEAIQYYPTGEVKLRRSYVHGVEVGEEKIYYRNGNVMSIIPFKDGRKDGKHIFNHPDGSREEVEYEAGECKQGSAHKFDKNGKERKDRNEKPDGRGEPGPKKILPGDHVPASVSRRTT